MSSTALKYYTKIEPSQSEVLKKPHGHTCHNGSPLRLSSYFLYYIHLYFVKNNKCNSLFSA